ncbi:Eco57I restriction-modification methylase domain-containing protein [Streptomyces paludis]|uniref:Eco57I restriction-modification methylase domain-containing protein n=1 Tax=Streptomyces paludis TaxID=2282738 RepID=UPI0015F2E1AE|nr:DNA methyltransferase [Streptomyces paludis]
MSRRPDSAARGLAAARAKALDGRAQHQEWLDLTEVTGPFLTLPVLRGTWPQLDAIEKSQREALRGRHADWQTDPRAGRDEWIAHILRDLLEWGDALTLRQGDDDDPLLDRFTIHVPEHNARLRADFALREPGSDPAAEPDTAAAAKRVPLLGMILPAGTVPTARDDGAGGGTRSGNGTAGSTRGSAAGSTAGSMAGSTGGTWSATPADRLARLCRHHGIPLGLATDGRWWCLVWAPVGGVTTTAVLDSIGWNEAAERNVVRAWISMLRRSRFFQYEEKDTLVGLLKRSLEAGEEVTDALGVQVRQAVELLVDAISRADARAMENGAPGLYREDIAADDVYRGAVAVMMRVVFLLFAEEHGLLPADNEVYARSYSARFLRAELKARADAEGEASLEHTTAAWHRLIALFHAVHGGVNHPELNLPAYDGSLFDPRKYAWLESTNPLLPIDDRTVLHMLQAVQEVQVGTGKNREIRTLSFRTLGVEEIGYVYEGLLSYDGERAVDTVVGLIGPTGREHEVELRELEALAAGSQNIKTLAKKIVDAYKEPKPGIGTPAKIERLLAPLTGEQRTEAERLIDAACKERELTQRLLPFFGIIRRDLRGLPVVIRPGALYVTESPLRKNTGTHYTPRRLAEEVVHHALEPLVYEPGPLQTADRTQWVLKKPHQILELKVADIAMGSAAFLVAACRYLANSLIEAWENDGRPEALRYRAGRRGDAITAVDAESDQVVVEARRQVIEHCLYGVDINPMAVEMAKLSLWLVSMDPTRPFTFLDDRLVAGDSLLGVANMQQLESIHLKPTGHDDIFGWVEGARTRVDQLTRERLAITAIKGIDLPALLDKRERLAQVNLHAARLRLVGDLIVAAGLATCASGRVHWYDEQGGTRLRDLFPTAASIVGGIVAAGVADDAESVCAARASANEWLRSELPDGGLERRPVHWPLEFPEVFSGRSGFDAIIGNPPFLGGQKLTGAMGEAYREYLVDYLAGGKRGSADLVAYFELRAHSLLGESGQTGLIATNTLAQGDTREVALDQLMDGKFQIRRAVKSEKWPSRSAVLEYCAVWTTARPLDAGAVRILDGLEVRGITSSLYPESRVSGRPHRLASRAGQSFQGSNVLGKGFVLTWEQAEELIESDPRNRDVIFPYLNGEDLNSRPDCSASRQVINFHDWTEEQAREYPEVFAIIERDVKPERAKNKRTARRERWWQYAERAPRLYASIAGIDRVLVVARVSKTGLPVLTSTAQVMSEQTVVFSTGRLHHLAFLSSGVHYTWAVTRASSLKGDLRYTPSDVYETLPQPVATEQMERVGTALNELRGGIMADRQLGLTKLYNMINDRTVVDSDISSLRGVHREIDAVVTEAYGWSDLTLGHGFYSTRQGARFTVAPSVQTEILDRLLELNHAQYRMEAVNGIHASRTRSSMRRNASTLGGSPNKSNMNTDSVALDSLF